MKLHLAGGRHDLAALNLEAERLRALGFEVNEPRERLAGWLAEMRAVIAEIVACDAIALMPDWRREKQARAEADICRLLGMPILIAAELKRPPKEYAP